MNPWTNIIKNYTTYLKLEKGLSENSVEAFVRDLTRFGGYCKDLLPQDVQGEHISDYLIFLNSKEDEKGEAKSAIAESSQARVLSSLKSFYKYLLFEGVIEADPCELVDAPKIGRKFLTKHQLIFCLKLHLS